MYLCALKFSSLPQTTILCKFKTQLWWDQVFRKYRICCDCVAEGWTCFVDGYCCRCSCESFNLDSWSLGWAGLGWLEGVSLSGSSRLWCRQARLAYRLIHEDNIGDGIGNTSSWDSPQLTTWRSYRSGYAKLVSGYTSAWWLYLFGVAHWNWNRGWLKGTQLASLGMYFSFGDHTFRIVLLSFPSIWYYINTSKYFFLHSLRQSCRITKLFLDRSAGSMKTDLGEGYGGTELQLTHDRMGEKPECINKWKAIAQSSSDYVAV